MCASTHAPKWINWKYLVSVLILLLGLAGCSPASEENINTLSENNFVSGGEDVVITFSGDESLRSIIEPLTEAFHEEYPSITVQYVPLSMDVFPSGTTTEDKLLMLASSADATLTAIRSAYTGNYFLDLQPLIDADASFDQADFWSGTLSGMEDIQGRITGLPMTLYLQGIFFDKAAFDTANLSYPQPGWTWDDFRSATAALAKVEGSNVRYGYADRASGSILRPLVGYDLALNDGKINAETLAADLEWYVQMVQEKQILSMRSIDGLLSTKLASDNPPTMWSGSLLEYVFGSITGGRLATDLTEFFTESVYGFAPFPVDADGEHTNTTPISAKYGAISRGSEHPQEAWQWLKFLSTHWLVSDTNDTLDQLYVPARQSVAEEQRFWDNYPSEIRDAMQFGLEHAWFSSYYSKANSAVLNAVQNIAIKNSGTLISALENIEIQQASWPQEIPYVPEITVLPSEITASGVTTINFYYNGSNEEENVAIAELIDQFNKDHQFDIVVRHSTAIPREDGGYYERLSNGYDCFISQLDAEEPASSGAILDLTPLMEAEDAAFQQDFDPLLLDAAQYNQGLYALPLYSQPAIMTYNADLLAKLGLEPPSIDWTFDDFLELITSVSSTSDSKQIYGFLPVSQRSSTIEMFFAGAGVKWRDISGDFPVVMINTPEMANAITWRAELEQSGVIWSAASIEDYYSSLTNAIRSGQIGFWITLAGEQEWEYFVGTTPSYNIGIVPLPYTDKPNGSYDSSYMTGIFISNQTEDPKACWELAKYISEKGGELFGVPARTSVANSAAWEAYVGAENAAVYRAAIASSLNIPEADPYGSVLWQPISGWLGRATENIRNGNNAAQELAQTQQLSDAYLACMASYDILNLNRNRYVATAEYCAARVDPD